MSNVTEWFGFAVGQVESDYHIGYAAGARLLIAQHSDDASDLAAAKALDEKGLRFYQSADYADGRRTALAGLPPAGFRESPGRSEYRYPYPTLSGYGFINEITQETKDGKRLFFAKVNLLIGEGTRRYNLLVGRVAEDIVSTSVDFGIDCSGVFKRKVYRLDIELRGADSGILTCISNV